MRDRDVRGALLSTLDREHAADDTRIVQEFGLFQGETRVDVVAINGELTGYEIKSPADTLDRLPKQQALYSRVLDRAWLVVGEDFLATAAQSVPEWWGLIRAVEYEGAVSLDVHRQAKLNPAPDGESVAQLLWRKEALELLAERGQDSGFHGKPRAAIWAKLAAVYPLEELRGAVRTRLKERTGWRVGQRPSRGGVRSPAGATFLGSLEMRVPARTP